MPIVRWDPFSDMVQFRDEVGRWFDSLEKKKEAVVLFTDLSISEFR